MKSVLPILALSMALTGLAGCSQVADNSLLTNDESSTGTVVDKTPLSTEVSLSADSSNIAIAASTGAIMQAEITGSCYTSTYPTNAIRVYRSSDGAILTATDLKSAASVGYCRDGRFAMTISAAMVAVGTTELKLVLSVYDASGVETVNQANAVKYINLTRPN